MAETVASTSDFDALTTDFTPKVLVDNIFVGTPVLLKFRNNMIAVDGRAWTPLIEYASHDGEWYDEGDIAGTPTTVTGQIARRAKFTLKFYRRKLLLDAQQTDLQGNLALVSVLQAHIKNAINSARVNLSTKLFTGNPAATPAEMNSLNLACDNLEAGNDWGDVDVSTYTTWKAHVMEGTDTFATAVSPTIENLSQLIQETLYTSGELPDLGIVDPAYWRVLVGQIDRDQMAIDLATHKGSDVIKWGFSALFIDGVPFVPDRDCQGAAWVAAQASRDDAAGYQAYLVNFNRLKMAYNRKRSFKWDPDGWRRPTNYDQYLNYYYQWVTIGSNKRWALGRQYNVDITQAPADWVPGTVTIPS